MRMRDRVAIVTASGGPMGRAIAERLAQEGASLVLNDISARRLDASLAAFTASGWPAVGLRADVCNRPEAEALVTLAEKTFGGVDALVNVVGGLKGAIRVALDEIDDERWDATMRLNLKGCLHMTKLAAPLMRASGQGRIVNISSISYAGVADQADYAAAKAGVAAFSRSCALALAPSVTVNCIMPGLIETSVLERESEQAKAALRNAAPLCQLGKPRDIANDALFFLSDEAAHITGQFLAVSGGIWPSL
ncbi:MAG: SDR family oxidoreductase [Alphaproteobacteria bacterium]|nr:SDR family oxidoreductase [Alphaproteobacteria bacterium]